MTRPGEVPDAAPPGLRRFVACEIDEVTVDLGDTAWLGEIPIASGAEITVRPGATSTGATIRIDKEFVPTLDLEISIVDGELTIDVPGTIGEVVGEPVTRWADALNARMKRNGKQLRDLAVAGNRITLRKQPIPPLPPDDETGGVVAPPPVITPPDGDGEKEKKRPTGCLVWILGAIAAVGAAVGIGFALTSDDGDEITTEVVESPAPPATDPPATEPPPTEAPPPATETEVGAVPDDDEDDQGDEPQVACGELPAGSQPGSADIFLQIGDGTGDVSCRYLPGQVPPCDEAVIPCATGSAPAFLLAGATPGVNHQQTVNDLITGDPGASKALFDQYVDTFGADLQLVVQSTCGGNLLTGGAPAGIPGVVRVEQPLLSFGPCGVTEWSAWPTDSSAGATEPVFRFTSPEAFPPGWASYEVGPGEPAPGAPADIGRFVVSSGDVEIPDDWSDDQRTILNTLGGNPLPTQCTVFFPPDDVDRIVGALDQCDGNRNFWVFAAGLTDVEVTVTVEDTVLAHGGGFINPLGTAAPLVGDTSAFATGDELFGTDDSPGIFPCGAGHLGFTACPPDDSPVDDGGFVAVNVVTIDDIPISSDGTERVHTIDFGSSGGPSYEVEQTADGWAITSSENETQARAIIRGNSLTVLAPQHELPQGPLSYELSQTIDGRTTTQPVLPIRGLITTPAVLGESPPAVGDDEGAAAGEATETLPDFYDRLGASLSSGDLGFSIDRLDPAVTDLFPTECPATIGSLADPGFSIEFVSEDGRGPWTFEVPDGRSVEIDDAVTVTLRISGRGQSGDPVQAHVAIFDDEYYWFTFC